MRRVVGSFVVLLSTACSDDGVATSGSSSTGKDPASSSSGSMSASDTGAPPTSTPTTSETGDPIDETTTTATGTTSGTTTPDASSTTGPEPLCGPPCDDPWVHRGDLFIDDRTDLSGLRCLVEVTGSLELANGQPTPPAELASLRRIGESLDAGGQDALTSLAGLECLESVGALSLTKNPALADISALAGLERVTSIRMWSSPLVTDLSPLDGVAGLRGIHLRDMSGVPRLPIPGDDAMLWSLRLEQCHALTDLDAIAGVSADPTSGIEVELIDLPKLASIAGLADKWGDQFSVRARSLPALTSLHGLEGLEDGDYGQIVLRDLPQIADLEPLAGLERIGGLHLDGMPKVKTLAPLAGLRKITDLTVGSCSDLNQGTGMDGLTTLAPLDDLESLSWLYIARNDALTELPQFAALNFDLGNATLIDNPAVPEAEVAAFTDEHASCAQPPMSCICFEDAPNP